MAIEVRLSLPEAVYRNIQRRAALSNSDVAQFLVSRLAGRFGTDSDPVDLTEPDPDADREMTAWIALHPRLRETHFGQHVAIYHGQVIDSDPDPDALFDRIDRAYPGAFVWISRVSNDPLETVRFRSPRLDDRQ